MTEVLTVPDLTLLFLGLVVCLAAGLVWVFWDIEQRQRQRKASRPRSNAR
jgi:hypothetical protein